MMRALLLLPMAFSVPALAGGYRGHVYDGDTIGPTMRLTIDGVTSFDTPEMSRMFGAQCDLEVERGRVAHLRLRAILVGPGIAIVPLVDARGAMRTDGHGRGLVRLERDGVNVGYILAREGHAMLYDWRRERVDWCAASPGISPRERAAE